jgi:hypothetical protein
MHIASLVDRALLLVSLLVLSGSWVDPVLVIVTFIALPLTWAVSVLFIVTFLVLQVLGLVCVICHVERLHWGPSYTWALHYCAVIDVGGLLRSGFNQRVEVAAVDVPGVMASACALALHCLA